MTAEPRVLSGRYRVDELIGRGGMATVFRGYDLTLGRQVAIKLLNRDLANDNSFRTRFRLEAQAASRMAHPTIVRVYDAGEDTETSPDGTVRPVPYIVMELVHGALLKDVIDAGPVPVEDAVRYVDGILEALEYSHRAGVVHRDIKPGNVMVTEAGQVKVMDFGIARAVSDSSSTVAETTAILGTAAYFSPEQAKGEPVDARADVYSSGVVLYELLVGRPPFRGESPVAVAYQHVSEAPVPPSEVNETVPRSLDAVVLRALAKDPFQRYQDAAAFRESLDATVGGKVPSKRAVGALTSELYGPNPKQAAETARSLRQLSTDTTMKRTQAGPPVAWIWAGVAIIAVLLISVFFWVMTIRPGSEVPSSCAARSRCHRHDLPACQHRDRRGRSHLVPRRRTQLRGRGRQRHPHRPRGGRGGESGAGSARVRVVGSGDHDRSDARRAGAGCRGRGAAVGRARARDRHAAQRPGSGRRNRDLVGSAGRRDASARSDGQSSSRRPDAS